MNKATHALALSALVLASSGLQTAFAEVIPNYDQKNYSGASCIALDGKQASLLVNNVFGVKNMSTTQLNVSCPIVRDNNSPIAKTVEVFVFTTDQGSVGTTICGLSAVSQFGQPRNGVSTKAGFGGLNTLYLNLQDPTGQPGIYQMTCNLKPGSLIHSYQAIESLETDDDS